MKARVTVMLIEGVLDPQGEAIKHALNNIVFASVTGVRHGNVIELDIEGSDKSQVRTQIENMCNKMLANTVLEHFEIELIY